MGYRINEIGNSLVLTGEDEHAGTSATISKSELEGKSEAVRSAYLGRVFAETHLQRVREDEGIGRMQA